MTLRILHMALVVLLLCAAAPSLRSQNNAARGAIEAFTVTLRQGDDLLRELERFTSRRQIGSGFILSASGTLEEVRIELPERTNVLTLTGLWSLASLSGRLGGTNSLVNIVATDAQGRTFGGRLAVGSRVQAASVMLADFKADSEVITPVVTASAVSAPSNFSPEILPDRRVIFRLRAPEAKEVSVSGDWGPESKLLSKDNTGVWSGVIGPLQRDIYNYTFSVDGLRMLDPVNTWVKPSRSPRSSIVDVRSDALQFHHFQSVPHGVLRLHTYESKSLKRERRLVVYTPPDYDKNALSRFPTLYLLHGNGDTERTWSVLGRAHFILDNLIATGKAKPMLIVMPDAHSLPPEGAGPDYRVRNREAFRTELIQEIIPFVEGNYRTVQTKEGRALAGLSMGGGQALVIGMNELAQFAWIGGFSPSLPDAEEAVASIGADGKAVNDQLQLLWFACGKDDFLIDHSRRFDQLLSERGVRHAYVETDGAHTWRVWRRYLADFAPLIFTQPSEAAPAAAR